MIDATEIDRALARPEIRLPARYRPRWQRLLGLHRLLGPKTYRGRILSHREWAPFMTKFERWTGGEVELDEALPVFEDYLRAIGIPPGPILRLPGSLVLETMRDFFTSQVRADTWGATLHLQTSETPPEPSLPNGSERNSRKTPAPSPSPSRSRNSVGSTDGPRIGLGTEDAVEAGGRRTG